MKLTIDTSKTRIATVTFGKFQKTSHDLLPLIAQILKDQNMGIQDITEIEVHTGPGSFTGLRVGCAVANALGMFLDIPVNGKRSLATPSYS